MKKWIIIASTIALLGILILINYLYTKNYDFKLIGSDTILLNIGDTWEDPLYTVKNNHKIKITNNINYNEEGEYQVIYSLQIGLFKKTLVRKIIITNPLQETDFNFTIMGDNPYYLMHNYDYIEPGYKAIDKIDGDITNQVTVTNNINKSEENTYSIIYQVKNSNGIIKKIERKVVVYSLKFKGSLKTTEYSKDNDIIIEITDNNYGYTILPNNEKNENKIITYHVTENKLYSFKIYDTNNNYTQYDVNVKTIDNTPPTGSCTLTLNDKNGVIETNAKDNFEIKGYEYQYGSYKTQILESNKYTVNTLDNKSSVVIYDKADNKTTINCNTVDKSTVTTRNYSLLEFSGRKYWFYTPKGASTRSKAPLVIYLHGGGITNVNAINNYALPKNIKNGKAFPYYAAIPFYLSYNIPSTNDYVIKLIDYLVNKHNIDPERIVISGGSNGSDPAYYIAAKNQKKFSAMIIIAGHTSISDLSKLTYLPVWFHQGEKDSYSNIAKYVTKLNSLGGNAKITKYKGGHDAPNNAFASNNVTNWILDQKTKK